MKEVYVDDKVRDYVLDLVRATREPAEYKLSIAPLIAYGASPRATLFLTRAARAILDRVAGILVQYPPLQLEVAGHTDAQGDRNYNRWLSEQRAKAVRDYLTTRGVSPENITARGYGSEQPIADNSTREGLLKNRRVELRRLP